jgi:hypothetical protein
MLTKGRISYWIGHLLQINEMTKEDLLQELFYIQGQCLIPIAPFQLEDGKLSSRMIGIVISEMLTLKIIELSQNKLRLTKKGLKLLTSNSLKEPVKCRVTHPKLFLFSKTTTLNVKGKTLKAVSQAPEEVIKFSHTLLPTPEIGTIFSVHQNNPIFRSAIPMFYVPRMQYHVFTPTPDSPLGIENFHKNLRSLKSFGYNQLKDKFCEERFLQALEIVYFNLLPISSVRVEVSCDKKHIRRKYYTKHEEAVLSRIENRCLEDGCFSEIKYVGFAVSNEKVFIAWRNGVLMEWFAAATLLKPKHCLVLWNVELFGLQCDAVAIDTDRVTVVECKRTNSYDSVYKEGVKQLEEIRNAFEKNGFNVQAILLTTVSSSPKKEKGIDAIVTQENYLEFCDNPYSLFK